MLLPPVLDLRSCYCLWIITQPRPDLLTAQLIGLYFSISEAPKGENQSKSVYKGSAPISTQRLLFN